MKRLLRLAISMAAIFVLGLAGATMAQAATGKVLLYGPSVQNGATSTEALQAQALGYTVDVVSASTWDSMTRAQFASYRAIVIGDNNDSGDDADLAGAEANVGVWGPAVTGNIMLSGADAEYHSTGGGDPGAVKYINRTIAYAAATDGHTGFYASLGGYYGTGTPPKLLDALSPGGFTMESGGGNTIHIDPATIPHPTGLTDADLSDWGTTTHRFFSKYPSTFRVWAVTEGGGGDSLAALPPGTVTTSDGHTGLVSFLVSERTPPAATVSAPGCSKTGVTGFTVTDNVGGSGAKALHYQLNGGATQTVPTSGAGSLTLPEGRNALVFWGEDQLGNQGAHQSATVVVDRTAPRLTITSNAHTTHYSQGQKAFVTVSASDATSGLAVHPSARSVRLFTGKPGSYSVSRSATDLCGNLTRAKFRYTVKAKPRSRPARISVRGVKGTGRGCTRSSFTARISIGSGTSLRRVRVTLNGRTIATTRSHHRNVTVPIGRVLRGGNRLTVTVTARSGRVTRHSVMFRRCALAVRFTG